MVNSKASRRTQVTDSESKREQVQDLPGEVEVGRWSSPCRPSSSNVVYMIPADIIRFT